jgi:hypothetical protein
VLIAQVEPGKKDEVFQIARDSVDAAVKQKVGFIGLPPLNDYIRVKGIEHKKTVP